MIGHEDIAGNECVGAGLSEWRDGGPIPRRFLWLRRLAVASGCLLIGLVGLRGWWGFEAHHRLQAEIERYHSAGQPVYASEFDEALERLNALRELMKSPTSDSATLT